MDNNKNNMPRPEYPRPDLVRSDWMNLNGEWDYITDRGLSGFERGYQNGDGFNEKIIVPFCRESTLSGIGDVDFCSCVWYKKQIEIPENIISSGKRTILHIGACDYQTDVFVNGKHVGTHTGGYVSFSFDITSETVAGSNLIIIRAEDNTRSPRQATGKQRDRFHSYGCLYTGTTGIWQTVWLEFVPGTYITKVKYYPDIDSCRLTAQVFVSDDKVKEVSAIAKYNGKVVGEARAKTFLGKAKLEIMLSELHLWEVGNGRLYDIDIYAGDDKVSGYFGMRQIDVKDGIMYLNGSPVFQRLVLDQGFYPDGIYTAPTLEALHRDVDLSMEMGFNGARLHQKVFEPLFLEYCDRKGYIVWGEHANWGMAHNGDSPYAEFLSEWCEIIERDFNHPAIIGWCPLNETPADSSYKFMKTLSDITRAYDPTRLYIDASGWKHQSGLTDIVDMHDYNQDPVSFKAKLDGVLRGSLINLHEIYGNSSVDFYERPTFVSEYGGTWWEENAQSGWGYGNSPKDEEEFKYRFKGLTEAIMNCPYMGALCYTQLTDVEQEKNGLYTYDRKPKFSPDFFKKVLSQTAQSEKN